MNKNNFIKLNSYFYISTVERSDKDRIDNIIKMTSDICIYFGILFELFLIYNNYKFWYYLNLNNINGFKVNNHLIYAGLFLSTLISMAWVYILRSIHFTRFINFIFARIFVIKDIRVDKNGGKIYWLTPIYNRYKKRVKYIYWILFTISISYLVLINCLVTGFGLFKTTSAFLVTQFILLFLIDTKYALFKLNELFG